ALPRANPPNLSPGLKLLAHLIEYIQTMVAIEEEKRERAFQDTIATWGIGLATGAIVASVAGQFPFASDNTWLVPVMSIGISFVAAVVAGLVTKVIRLRRR
ncbi:MAG: hypothetical protein KAI83_00140, partial [Thiomargarita sp.]|nr:hypothetical protein [Thiomargarita sp.]